MFGSLQLSVIFFGFPLQRSKIFLNKYYWTWVFYSWNNTILFLFSNCHYILFLIIHRCYQFYTSFTVSICSTRANYEHLDVYFHFLIRSKELSFELIAHFKSISVYLCIFIYGFLCIQFSLIISLDCLEYFSPVNY